ncbi:hypothetical protein TPA0908_36540 [Micromonospora sp. AKA38]|nr:hypothetical protein TPA0908_36540 [Micromonospora sp. AKA38]
MNAMALGTKSSTDLQKSVQAALMSTWPTARVFGMMSLLSRELRRPHTRRSGQHAGPDRGNFPT